MQKLAPTQQNKNVGGSAKPADDGRTSEFQNQYRSIETGVLSADEPEAAARLIEVNRQRLCCERLDGAVDGTAG